MIKYEFIRARGKGSEGSEKGEGANKRGGAKKRGVRVCIRPWVPSPTVFLMCDVNAL